MVNGPIIDTLIVFGFASFSIYCLIYFFRQTRREAKEAIINTILARRKRNEDERWIPVDDDENELEGENLDKYLEEQNREEECDTGDDDAILGL